MLNATVITMCTWNKLLHKAPETHIVKVELRAGGEVAECTSSFLEAIGSVPYTTKYIAIQNK